MTSLIGSRIDRYEIVSQLGEGGMATVYKAYDTRLERYVALKVITANQQTSQQYLQRFEREAKSLAKLAHSNIVQVHDYGEQNGTPYLVMEFIEGGTLKSQMGTPHAVHYAANLLAPVAQALEFAHKQNIIHRDVKPANILIRKSGQPMLSDFGIAKVLEVNEPALTQLGVGIGTPEYMAPEQGQGAAVDHRADVYSLGVVFYEMVTGRKPFRADTPMAVVWKQATEPLPDPRLYVPTLPANVVAVLQKALQKRPDDRYQDMGQFAAALQKLADEQPTATSLESATVMRPRPLTVAPTQPDFQPAPPLVYPKANTGYRADPLPPQEVRMPAYSPPVKKKRMAWWVWVIIGGALLGVLACGALVIFGALDFLLAPTVTPRPTATLRPTFTREPTATETLAPTLTPTEAPTATPEPTWTPVSDTSNPLVLCYSQISPYLLEGLTPVFCDQFNDNSQGWFDGETDDDYRKQVSYTDGEFLWWEIAAKRGVMTYETFPTRYVYGDFGAQVDIIRVSGATNSDAGLLFRVDQSAGSYYFVTISDANQKYAIYRKMPTEWVTIRGWTDSEFIYPDTWNTLTVFGEGQAFYIYINGTFVDWFEDSEFTTGQIGIGYDIYDEGAEAIFVFDNIIGMEP